MCIPKDVDDDEHDIHLDAGTQELAGQEALNYVRERHVLSVTGDIGRMKRQQAFIASMVNKVMSAGTLARPDRVYSLPRRGHRLDQGRRGPRLPRRALRPGPQLKDTGLAHIKFVTVPFAAYAARPQPAGLGRRGEGPLEADPADQPLGDDFSEESSAPTTRSVRRPAQSTEHGGSSGESSDDEERLAAGLCA